MATKRVKPTNLVPIKDTIAADAALKEIAALQRSIGSIEATMNNDIDQIKSQAETAAEPHRNRLAALTNGLLAFAEFNKDELFTAKKKKSVELTFGFLGFRKSTKVKTAKRSTWKSVLARLKELGFEEAVTVKESVNKEVLRTWPDERLDLVGAVKDVGDEFWFEIKEEEVKGAA